MLIPRTTVTGTVNASCPIPKAIKCARKPVTLDATRSPAPTLPVMHQVIPRITRPPLAHDGCEEGSSHRAKRPSGTATRSARRSSPGIQRTSRSPVAVLIYLYPGGERANEPALHPDARSGSSAAGKPEGPSAHTPPPVRPRLLTEPARKSGPLRSALRRLRAPQRYATTVRAPQSVSKR